MRSARPVFTTECSLGAGPVVRQGSLAAYRSIVEMQGEPHIVRSELLGTAPPGDVMQPTEPIACFAHITDLHVTDAQSPARFEFVNKEGKDPRFRELLTMQRPQEMLNARAIDALVETINGVDAAPLTGSAIQLIAMTGDAIDNTQHNEMMNFLSLMNGGLVRPDSGAPGYDGVQLTTWPGNFCWKPDGADNGDQFQSALGFPGHPGLLDQAIESFLAKGLNAQWLGCYGNHEQVCQGVGIVTPAVAEAMTGSRKPFDLPPSFDRQRAVETFVRHPEEFMKGASLPVSPDPDRRPISRREFIDAHHSTGGHGFTIDNSDDAVAYYVHDLGDIRFITLDTVCDAGGADGTIDRTQLRWLEQRLEESRDRYIILLSHHGYDALSNPRGERRAQELLNLLLRFSNVVLWLNGHIHANRITPRHDSSTGHGLWEVTTASLVDWPCQARLVEIFKADRGTLAIGCTMLDHDGAGLAGLHRELAANVPFNGFDSRRPGTAADRNAILLLPSPP